MRYNHTDSLRHQNMLTDDEGTGAALAWLPLQKLVAEGSWRFATVPAVSISSFDDSGLAGLTGILCRLFPESTLNSAKSFRTPSREELCDRVVSYGATYMSSREFDERKEGGRFSRRISSRLLAEPILDRSVRDDDAESPMGMNVPRPPSCPFVGLGFVFFVGGGSYRQTRVNKAGRVAQITSHLRPTRKSTQGTLHRSTFLCA